MSTNESGDSQKRTGDEPKAKKTNPQISSKPDQKRSNEQQKHNQNYKYRKRRYYSKNKKSDSQQSSSQHKKSFKFRKVSVLIPLLNEEESLRPLYNEIRKAFNTITPDYEIFFVDDGSTDDSLKVIKDLSRQDRKVRYISFRKNYGKSAALQVGFKNVTGDAVITMDADLQDDPAEIPSLLAKLEEGYDLVSGWKKQRFDPFIKKHTSKFFNYITKITSGIKIHDFNCGLKAYRKEVVKSVEVYGELHRYIPVLAGWKGFKITEIPVRHHARKYGKTKFGISRFFKGFIDLITVIFTTRYIQRPLHLFGLLGAIAFLAGVVINAYLTYEWIQGVALGNRPLLFLGILLIIVGVQLIALGLLGEIMVHKSQDERVYGIKAQK
ncbi:MAG: glycosyltransferase family 2 protein [Ignavibacteriae bacterium]|jgi:glycosyltransferase involved in cell wall biosynthesis|nr:glycosyltransferase [Ignavibacteriota bacterium]NOG97769.1 glycosyltransferase family 2 protein [Ignavibacteriota bacterium]